MQWKSVYGGGRLDRAGAQRKDGDWSAAQRRHPHAFVVPLWQDRCLVRDDAAIRVPARSLGAAGGACGPPTSWVLLGVEPDGAPLFAADLGDDERQRDELLASTTASPSTVGPATSAAFADLRGVTPRLSADDAAMLAYARGILLWHRRARYCGVCGAPTEARDCGHVRACTNAACGTEHHPRTDPAVIMLVERTADDGERRCLLAHHGRLAPGMFSTLAGFVEPGETLEEAVVREVGEETGVRCEAAHYRGSQPWPFPASLMIAFRAIATTEAITVDGTEVREARWFSAAELRAAGEWGDEGTTLMLPRRESIARSLIEEWLAER